MLPRTGTSHRQYVHPVKTGRVTIAGHPSVDVDPGSLKSILRQAGFKIMNMKYTAIYAKTKTGYSGHIPDLPGCIAAARTLAQTKRYMREAVALHLQGMREDGTRIPRPSTVAAEVEAA
jgi:predicted RNase H-like HicB family nuclease